VYAPRSEWLKLMGESLGKKAKADLMRIALIVLDEFSMTGKGILSYIDQLFRHVDPSRADVAFGGRSVIMCGN